MKRRLLVVASTFVFGSVLSAAPRLVGHWGFSDETNLGQPVFGNPLGINGTAPAWSASMSDGSGTSLSGVVTTEAGSANYFLATHDIGANGGGTRTNQYTLVFDVKRPSGTKWRCFYQTDLANGNDGEYFTRGDGGVTNSLGRSTIGYTPEAMPEDTWIRLVVSVDLGNTLTTYIDGVKVKSHNALGTDNGDYSLDPSQVLLFADNNGENQPLDVGMVAIFDGALTDLQAEALGHTDDPLALPEPTDLLWTGANSFEWNLSIIQDPKNWVRAGDGTTKDDFENYDAVFFDDSATRTSANIGSGDVRPTNVTFSNETKDFTLTGIDGIVGSCGLTKNGAAALRIENANSFTGVTFHNNGTLVLANENALQGSTLATANGNAVVFDGVAAAVFGGLSGNGDILLENKTGGAVALTIGGNNFDETHSGTISGAGAIVKTGDSQATLAGTNTYTGGTTIQSGTLVAADEDAFGTGPVVSTGGILEFSIADGVESTCTNDIVLPVSTVAMRMFGSFAPDHLAPGPGTAIRLTGKISGGSTDSIFRFGDTGIVKEHDNITILDNPDNDFLGTIQLWRSSLVFTSDGALGAPDNDLSLATENLKGAFRFGADGITVNKNRSIHLFNNGNPVPIDTQDFTGTIAGDIVDGESNLVKQGTGTLVLTGTNNATGPTTIAEGTLRVDGAFAAGGGTVTATSTGTLAGTGTISRPVAIEGAVAPGASVGTLTVDSDFTLESDCRYIWEISDWTGDKGTGYDTVAAGFLNIGATSANPATILVTPKALANFTNTSRRFVLVSASSGIFGFSSDAFVVDAAALPGATGTWSVQSDGDNLILDYSAGPPSLYETWSLSMGLDGSPGKESGFSDDPEGDGVDNGLEWILGGDPLAQDAAATLPVAIGDAAAGLALHFTRNEDSIGEASLFVEWDSDLEGGFAHSLEVEAFDSVDPATGATVSVDANATPDAITVTIPASNAPDGKIFARLKATQP
jgi:autotransporter-associated beta strand protein